ncbi:malto-oligosyltrehalose trehalohydrolase [Edaphobacter sp. HDX4]|uniref:malto-oligosyltrehalose trehalohydrolase n=1 Tax=Edaphobacter sp. HDX4 TaxID=2794064 RepID=UPI002FE61544
MRTSQKLRESPVVHCLGALPLSDGTHFRVWAPVAKSVEVVLRTGESYPLLPQENGYFSAVISSVRASEHYKYLVDGEGPFPDPASRFQPEGPHGWSEIVDLSAYPWKPRERSNLQLVDQVIYELHIGTFTPEGTYQAAEREFVRLRELGITLLEIMPVSEFPGEFGWGYDGVFFFAPHHHYGTPRDLCHMVEAAHGAGLSVILDVVYNHYGPDGNYLPQYSPFYASDHPSEWGEAPNFAGEHSEPVREFFIQNARYWIREFQFDGLRFDATQAMVDSGDCHPHILTEISCAARAAAEGREIILMSECERQWCHQLASVAEGGSGLDGMWNDDLHHSAIVRLTGKREAYYTDHLGKAQEFVSAAKWSFLFQGQFYSWQKAPRGTPFVGVEPWQAVTFLENHDQIANSLQGTRLPGSSSPRLYRAMVGYWLLTPGTPMFFMGQEYGSTKPFLYFCNQREDLCEKVRAGRADFLEQFESIRSLPDPKAVIPNPGDRATFDACKLDPKERERVDGRQTQRLFADLLRIRRENPVLRNIQRRQIDGAVLTDDCFVIRYFADQDEGHRLLVVNFGPFLELTHLPEPLLAPPTGKQWQCVWSSEQIEYGGTFAMSPVTPESWHIAEKATSLLIPSNLTSEP